jgi:hypothetical protein
MQRLHIAFVAVLLLVFALAGMQWCQKEEDTVVSAQAKVQTSCESCHSDNQALQALAVPEADGGSESSGEG